MKKKLKNYIYLNILFAYFISIINKLAVAYGAIANNSLTGYTPRISEQELENAQRAPVYTQCVKPGQVAFTCKHVYFKKKLYLKVIS